MATIAIALAVTIAAGRSVGGAAFLLPFLTLMTIQVLAPGCAVRLPVRVSAVSATLTAAFVAVAQFSATRPDMRVGCGTPGTQGP